MWSVFSGCVGDISGWKMCFDIFVKGAVIPKAWLDANAEHFDYAVVNGVQQYAWLKRQTSDMSCGYSTFYYITECVRTEWKRFGLFDAVGTFRICVN